MNFLLLFFILCSTQKTPFALETIRSPFPSNSRWSSHNPENIQDLLNQKFYYFCEGSQSFSFRSEDGELILKFFKQNKFFSKKEHRKVRTRKRDWLFKSYKIAAERFRKETGLLYLHLVPNDGFSKQVTIVDEHQNAYTFDLGDFQFVLQRYAHLVVNEIARVMDREDEEAAKKIIDKIFVFFRKRIDRGIGDSDPSILTNLSLTKDDEVIQIDLGKFFFTMRKQKNKKLIGEKNEKAFSVWLEERYPSLHAYYLESLKKFTKS
jgi:hypothetical protein